MTINITTWSPDTCRCELSYTNDSENPEAGSIFYAVHMVCDEHAHLATKATLSGERDDAKSADKFKVIEDTKARNLDQHQQAIKRAHLPHHKRELEDTTRLINEHNARVHTHFTEILAQPFAHDEHIYKAVLAENQTKNQAIGHLMEQNPHLTHLHITFSHDKARKLTLHVYKDAETKPTEEKFGITVRRVG